MTFGMLLFCGMKQWRRLRQSVGGDLLMALLAQAVIRAPF
jgi:hypothetical protein